MAPPAPSRALRRNARAQGLARCPQAQEGHYAIQKQLPHGQMLMLAAQRAAQGPNPRTAAMAAMGQELETLSIRRGSEQAGRYMQLSRQLAFPAGELPALALWAWQQAADR